MSDHYRSVRSVLESWTSELEAQANRVRHLIGSANWLADGFHKEAILREFLCRHLPKMIKISRGFVINLEDTAPVSGEIDILVSRDDQDIMPFDDGNLIITTPANCLSVIHVKTKFNTREIRDILTSTMKASIVLHGENVHKCAFFYENTNTAKSRLPVTRVLDVLKKIIDINDTVKADQFLPDLIVIQSGPIIVKRTQYNMNREPTTLSLCGYDAGNLSAAVLLSLVGDQILSKSQDNEMPSGVQRFLEKMQFPALDNQSLPKLK